MKRSVVAAAYAAWLLGLFARRAIDGGTAMSWLFLMGAMVVLRHGSVIRVERAVRRRWAVPSLALAGRGAAS